MLLNQGFSCLLCIFGEWPIKDDVRDFFIFPQNAFSYTSRKLVDVFPDNGGGRKLSGENDFLFFHRPLAREWEFSWTGWKRNAYSFSFGKFQRLFWNFFFPENILVFVTFTRKNLLIGGKNKLRLLIVSAFSHAMITVVAASPIMQIKWGSSRLFPRHPWYNQNLLVFWKYVKKSHAFEID